MMSSDLNIGTLTRKGIYILVIELSRSCKISIGKKGEFNFKSGTYLYVGSAFGTGGLKSRLKRHLKKEKKFHWHIDYLLDKSRIKDIYVSKKSNKAECFTAKKLYELPSIEIPAEGFGSSDYKCRSHLFYANEKYLKNRIKNILKNFYRL